MWKKEAVYTYTTWTFNDVTKATVIFVFESLFILCLKCTLEVIAIFCSVLFGIVHYA